MPVEILLLLSAVKGALLIGTALLLTACMRRASAAMRHALLMSAIIGALLMPLLGAALPALSPVPALSRAGLSGPELGRWGDEAVLLLLVRSDTVSELPVRSTLRAVGESSRYGILALWLAGTAAVLSRIAADFAAARRTRSRATYLGASGRGIPLLESADIDSPVATGLIRPAIMLPRDPGIEASALESVMGHELAHVDRRDCLTQLVVRLACAAFWFNPVVWYAAHRIGLERERACDDRVLASGADPIGYSKLLIDMARSPARAAARLHAAPSMARAAHLEKRIAGILDPRAGRRGMSRSRHAALALAAGCIVAPLAAIAVPDPPAFAGSADPFRDPSSERVAGVREGDPRASTGEMRTPDGRLMATLRDAAMREPAAPYDLVPDRARWALSIARGGRIIDPLLAELADPDWRVRGYAAWALALSRDRRAVEHLTPLLDDPVWRLRAMAASALRQIGDPRAAAALAGVLDDPAWQVRVEAVLYFGALREPGFREQIEPLRGDPHIAVRLAAVETLGEIP